MSAFDDDVADFDLDQPAPFTASKPVPVPADLVDELRDVLAEPTPYGGNVIRVARALVDAVERSSEDSCTCGLDDACSACGGATSEVMDVPTFNQCEVHGKCVDETWTDDHGVSHATCLGPIPEHVRHRLNALRIAAEMDKRHPGWREQGRVPPGPSISDEAEAREELRQLAAAYLAAWGGGIPKLWHDAFTALGIEPMGDIQAAFDLAQSLAARLDRATKEA